MKVLMWVLVSVFIDLSPAWAQRGFCRDQLVGRPSPQLQLLPVDLKNSVESSGLNGNQLSLIRDYSKGLIDIYELIRRGPQEGYLLGVTDAQEVYMGVSMATGLVDWEQAYYRFGIERDEKHHTQTFMEKIAKSEKSIVFLVPSQLFSHRKADNTKNEMLWLLKHPQVLKNVLFVFGALDIVDQKSWMQVMLTDGRHNLDDNSSYAQKKAHLLASRLKVYSSIHP